MCANFTGCNLRGLVSMKATKGRVLRCEHVRSAHGCGCSLFLLHNRTMHHPSTLQDAGMPDPRKRVTYSALSCTPPVAGVHAACMSLANISDINTARQRKFLGWFCDLRRRNEGIPRRFVDYLHVLLCSCFSSTPPVNGNFVCGREGPRAPWYQMRSSRTSIRFDIVDGGHDCSRHPFAQYCATEHSR